jgi:hypothetical protein
VIAFDWVDEPLRTQIPRLRAAVRRAKAGPQEAAKMDAALEVLVQPTEFALPVLPNLSERIGNRASTTSPAQASEPAPAATAS